MKRGLLLILALSILLNPATAGVGDVCDLDVSLINQDPYPASPGDHVKVVFQIDGTADGKCKEMKFQIEESYPFSLDPGAENARTIETGIFARNYNSYLLAPYKVRIDEEALDGENLITTSIINKQHPHQKEIKDFNITIEDSRTEFEIYVKDYDTQTNKLTLETINTGEKNAEAFLIQIPEQDNALIVGTDRKFIGDIDSNEEDSASFEAELQAGTIDLELFYTDQVNVRRTLLKTINFNPEPYERKVIEQSKATPTNMFFLGLAIPLVIIFILRWRRKKKEKEKKKLGIK